MQTIHRYSKDTIKGQVWETSIRESENSIILSEIHIRRSGFDIIKEVEKEITKDQAEAYKEKNKKWHIETYQIEI